MRAVIGVRPGGVDDPNSKVWQPLQDGFFEQVFFICDGFGEDDQDEEIAQDFESE